MALVRLKTETKSRLDQLGETMLRLSRAGAPGIRVADHRAGQYVPADAVISRAIQALEVELEADLELFHVSKGGRKK